MNAFDYWKECISIAAEDCKLAITPEQLGCLASSVESGHENYGQAFYSPPASDRISEVERESAAKLKALQREFDSYRTNAETAVKQALRQRPDESVSIGKHGDVFRHGGRTEQIQ